MEHDISLLTTVAAGFGLAFVLGLAAARVKAPPLLGYLVAGILVGPFTPGFVADAAIASQLAEMGVILLMFGVGLHFSIADLLAVRRIAVPGAIAQILVATILGAVIARSWDLPWASGLVFGLCLSVASTVVLLRALEDRGILDSTDGRIAVGWLIVEDLVTVLALVLLPAFARATGMAAAEGGSAGDASPAIVRTIAITLAKVAGFVIVMLVAGRRVVPWILGRVVGSGSRELFTLAVLALAVGIAVGAAALFDVSFALGAFFAGVIVSESDFSQDAASKALPLQDAFAVLFFVSVGMLFDPAILVQQPLRVLAVVLIVLLGKSIAAFGIVLAFRHSVHTALTISASLAQIGEFSFILAGLAVSLGLLPASVQSLVVAGALLSITLNPLAFGVVKPLTEWIVRRRGVVDALERPGGELAELPEAVEDEALADHVVLVGGGRVGEPMARELRTHGIPFVIIEASQEVTQRMREEGFPVLFGDATRAEVLERAHVANAKLVVVAAPDAFAARGVLARTHQLAPGVEVLLRTHSDAERQFLEEMGAARALVGERELAVSLVREALLRYTSEPDMVAVARRVLRPAASPG